MKVGTKPIPIKERIKQIHETIRIMQVINARDIARLVEISEPYTHHIIRFFAEGINRKKIVTKKNKFFVYFIGELTKDKELLIKSRYY